MAHGSLQTTAGSRAVMGGVDRVWGVTGLSKFVVMGLAWVLLIPGIRSVQADSDSTTTPSLQGAFGGREGCVVLYDSGSDQWTIHNESRARERFSPCSTFKIPNTLIGLETGVVQDGGTTFTWDGTVHSRSESNRDHQLRSAFQLSIVWYYQELARRVGEPAMGEWLRKFEYGNQDISGGLTKFWLGNSLRISAVEQVEFLRKLQSGSLPVSARSLEIVRDLMIVDHGTTGTLRGKTGSRGVAGGGYDLGWFVGWLERPQGAPVFFATQVEGAGAWGPEARQITRKVLELQGFTGASGPVGGQ